MEAAVTHAPPRQAEVSQGLHPVSRVVTALSVLFFLTGVLGFVPGVTTGQEALAFSGPESTALFLGLFQVSVLTNVLHLVFAMFGLALTRPARAALVFLVWGGVAQLVLWLYGLVVDLDSAANFAPFNTADNWLHLGLGVGMTAIGVVGRRSRGVTA